MNMVNCLLDRLHILPADMPEDQSKFICFHNELCTIERDNEEYWAEEEYWMGTEQSQGTASQVIYILEQAIEIVSLHGLNCTAYLYLLLVL